MAPARATITLLKVRMNSHPNTGVFLEAQGLGVGVWGGEYGTLQNMASYR
jgi:hypothetical protein